MNKDRQLVLDIFNILLITIEDDKIIPGELEQVAEDYIQDCMQLIYSYRQEIENEMNKEKEDEISNVEYDHRQELKYLQRELSDKEDEIDNLKNEISDLEYQIREL